MSSEPLPHPAGCHHELWTSAASLTSFEVENVCSADCRNCRLLDIALTPLGDLLLPGIDMPD